MTSDTPQPDSRAVRWRGDFELHDLPSKWSRRPDAPTIPSAVTGTSGRPLIVAPPVVC